MNAVNTVSRNNAHTQTRVPIIMYIVATSHISSECLFRTTPATAIKRWLWLPVVWGWVCPQIPKIIFSNLATRHNVVIPGLVSDFIEENSRRYCGHRCVV